MQISQIFLSDHDGCDLPPFLNSCTESVSRQYPDARHVIYDNKSLRDFIGTHYDSEILRAYDSLQPYAYKADLGRLCLLNTFGGLYIDISIRMINRMDFGHDIDLLAFRDLQIHSRTNWSCSNALVYSKPDNEVLRTAIRMIVENCKRKHYGITPLAPTGPALFGRALAMSGENPGVIFGDLIELTPGHALKNKAFVLPDGTILAWIKPSEGGDLKSLGATGVNDYNQMWRDRTVYS